MNTEIVEGLQMMARDKGLDYETLVDALEGALLAAYKRLPQAFEDSRVSFEDGDIRIFAQEVDDDGNVLREWDDTPDDFGRIAAQTAKQVLTQKLQAAERELKYEEYQGREGDIVTGIVQQKDARYTLLDLGKVEALMPQSEQVSYERVEQGARLKAYIVEVRKTAKGPQIVVSRTHPGLVLRLFELEVPEIADGVVEVRAIAREPGARTKIAVDSTDPNVDPVGACVGARGSRVRMIVNELRGEKVDIVPFSDDIRDYIAKALSPAKVREVRIDDETHTAEVIVPDFQLSLAIGKEGQNARLAARLTGWRVDIRSDQPEVVPEPEPAAAALVEDAGTDGDGGEAVEAEVGAEDEAAPESVATEEAGAEAETPAPESAAAEEGTVRDEAVGEAGGGEASVAGVDDEAGEETSG
ncbi:MAG: transcription termination/antitermination protein NusA [Acidimicrobiia bacterium]|nr:transcription termination/antitermination protein NusA [Acidimicrobiia bacterium]